MKSGYIEIKSWLLFMQRQPTESAKYEKLHTTQLLNMNGRKCENTKSGMSKDEQAGGWESRPWDLAIILLSEH